MVRVFGSATFGSGFTSIIYVIDVNAVDDVANWELAITNGVAVKGVDGDLRHVGRDEFFECLRKAIV